MDQISFFFANLKTDSKACMQNIVQRHTWIQTIAPWCPSKTRSGCPVSMSQDRAVLSEDPVNNSRLPSLAAKHSTPEPCPLYCTTLAELSIPQALAVLSAAPVISNIFTENWLQVEFFCWISLVLDLRLSRLVSERLRSTKSIGETPLVCPL